MAILGSVLLLLLLLTAPHKKTVDPLFYGRDRPAVTFTVKLKMDEFLFKHFFNSCASFVACPVFAEFSFTCLVGLTNALEQDGFISGFMGFYLKMVTFHIPI